MLVASGFQEIDERAMAEDNQAGIKEARVRLAAGDLALAVLIAAGDPAAELAARAIALNGGSLARAGRSRARILIPNGRSRAVCCGYRDALIEPPGCRS